MKRENRKGKIWLKLFVFILYPFAGLIRYGALKMMKKMRRPDDRRPIIATADHLLNTIVFPSAFRVFQDKIFREQAGFSKIPRSEHDRIFNELEVSAIYLAMMYLNTVKSMVRPEDYHFWQEVEEHLPRQLQKILMGYGVDGSNAKLMRQLIDMRRAEYEEIKTHIQDINSQENKEFKELSAHNKRIAAALQAIAVGTTDHIRRGKIKEGDPLISHLITWLIFLQKQIGKFVKNL